MSILPVLFNPTTLNIAQDTYKSVAVETALKATGRPTFALIDKNVDPETRKYAAVKEFAYQLLCLGLFMGLVQFIFKPAGYRLIKEKMAKSLSEAEFAKTGFKQFDSFDNFNKGFIKHKKLVEDVAAELEKSGQKDAAAMYKENYGYSVAKGAVDLISTAGSVVALTIVAPILNNIVVHPLMKAIGMDKEHAEGAKHGH